MPPRAAQPVELESGGVEGALGGPQFELVRRLVERVPTTGAFAFDPFELGLRAVELDLRLAHLGSAVARGLGAEQHRGVGRLGGGTGVGNFLFEVRLGDAGALEQGEPGARLGHGLVDLRALLGDAFQAGLRLDETHLDLADAPIRPRPAARARSRIPSMASSNAATRSADSPPSLRASSTSSAVKMRAETSTAKVRRNASKSASAHGTKDKRGCRTTRATRSGPGSKRASMASGSPNSAASVLLP